MAVQQRSEEKVPQKVEEAKKPVHALNPTRLKEASFVRNVWAVTPPAGTNVEELMAPEFWSHVGQMFKPNDKIEAIPEDSAWYAEFIVINASRLWVKVHVLSNVDLVPAKANMPLTDDQNHEVVWKGTIAKHVVIRKSDNTILKDGFQTQLEGWQWLDSHLKSIGH